MSNTKDKYFYVLQILKFQGKFKEAKINTIRKLVQKIKHPEKNPKQNTTSKLDRYKNVLDTLKVCVKLVKYSLFCFYCNKIYKF